MFTKQTKGVVNNIIIIIIIVWNCNTVDYINVRTLIA